MALDYQKDISIDHSALDVEWLRQPTLFMQYSEASAQAERRARKADENVKVTRSKLILEAKQSGEKYTETTLEAYYRTHQDHIDAKAEHDRALYEADILRSAVFAFQQRKTALEELVRLHSAGYFAGPKEPRDIDEELKKQRQENRESIKAETTSNIQSSLGTRRRQVCEG